MKPSMRHEAMATVLVVSSLLIFSFPLKSPLCLAIYLEFRGRYCICNTFVSSKSFPLTSMVIRSVSLSWRFGYSGWEYERRGLGHYWLNDFDSLPGGVWGGGWMIGSHNMRKMKCKESCLEDPKARNHNYPDCSLHSLKNSATHEGKTLHCVFFFWKLTNFWVHEKNIGDGSIWSLVSPVHSNLLAQIRCKIKFYWMNALNLNDIHHWLQFRFMSWLLIEGRHT